MNRKIYKNMFFLSLFVIFLTLAFLTNTMHSVLQTQMKNEVRSKAVIFENQLNLSNNDFGVLDSFNFNSQDERVSIINANGSMLFDSYQDTPAIEKHFDRPEIISAFASGYGEARRFSDTLGKETYYYAIKLLDGSVLRLSKTTDSITGIFIKLIPLTISAIIVIIILCLWLTSRLAKSITSSINNFNLENSSEEIYDELAPLITTISKQKRQIKKQTKSLENRTNTIDTITKNMKEGLILLDKTGLILMANESATRLFRNNSKDYIGKDIVEINRNPSLMYGVKSALTGNSYNTTIEVDSKTMQIFINPVSFDNQIDGAIILFLDITEKTKSEKIRKEFSANVSHELKTPLTTILGLSEMINSGIAKPEDIGIFAGKIKNEANRLINLIEDIIKLSQLDEKMGQDRFEQFDLAILANDVVTNLHQFAANKSVNVKIEGDNILINADKNMIYELLFNLVDNAIKYNKQDGNLILSFAEENKFVIIKAIDTGVGIPKKQLDRIFERFYRVDQSRSQKITGTGLGLSIVKHIVMAHHGEIGVKSQLGVGTTITIRLHK